MRNTEGIRKSAERRSTEAHDRVLQALRNLEDEGRSITFQSVAEKAGVSRAFLYGHEELKTVILKQRKCSENSRESSLHTIINMQKIEINRLQRELKQCQSLAEKTEKLEKENTELRAQLRTAYKY